jgi:hypothetical protein
MWLLEHIHGKLQLLQVHRRWCHNQSTRPIVADVGAVLNLCSSLNAKGVDDQRGIGRGVVLTFAIG